VAITKLNVALPRLGCGKIKAILYFASCEQQLSNSPLISDVASDITQHSYVTALIANYLSIRFFPDSDDAFLAALLHDVGKLAMLKEMATNYSISLMHDNVRLTEESFGSVLYDFHEKVGAMVARHWDLSPAIQNVIATHHRLNVEDVVIDEYDKNLVKLVHLSDTIARLLGHGRPVREPVDIPAMVEELLADAIWDEDTQRFIQGIPSALDVNSVMG
jgi:putative nucleotidyltransferase with HDIG domain